MVRADARAIIARLAAGFAVGRINLKTSLFAGRQPQSPDEILTLKNSVSVRLVSPSGTFHDLSEKKSAATSTAGSC